MMNAPGGYGVPCPECSFKIPVTIPDLLGGRIQCPVCGLVLEVDREASGEVLDMLDQIQDKLDEAQDHINKNLPKGTDTK